MSELTKRILSSLAIVALLTGLYLGFKEHGLYVAGVLIILGGAYEYWTLTIKKISNNKVIFGIFLVFNFCLLASPSVVVSLSLLGPLCVLLISTSLWLLRGKLENSKLQSLTLSLSFGLLYAGLLPKFALGLLLENQGLLYFLLLLVIVFASDIFAYVGGRLFGKTPFMPAISPNKTVEGSISGTLFSGLTAILFASMTHLLSGPLVLWFLAALLISFVSQTGDLFQSLLKRSAGVKDSGKFMPGHGGVLDRLDGVYFAAPVFWFLMQFVVNK